MDDVVVGGNGDACMYHFNFTLCLALRLPTEMNASGKKVKKIAQLPVMLTFFLLLLLWFYVSLGTLSCVRLLS
jgi:hypothetical protein